MLLFAVGCIIICMAGISNGHFVFVCGLCRTFRNLGFKMGNSSKKQDLRVQKTLQAIRSVFEEMVSTMKPEEITVKELTERAQINRKTFYLHYTCIEELYEEAIRRMAAGYFKEVEKITMRESDYAFNMAALTRVFFEYYAAQGPLAEKIICNDDYRQYFNRLSEMTLQHNCAQFNPYSHLPQEEQNLLFTYLCSASVEMYCRWVADGKKISLEKAIETASVLLTEGSRGYAQHLKAQL